MNTIGVGLIGAGFVAGIHARSFARLGDLGVRLAAVAAAHADHAERFAHEFGVPHYTDDYRTVLGRSDVDLVDLCVPNHLHHVIAKEAAQAGKHIICEKPLTGFFGPGSTPRGEMLAEAMGRADAMVGAARHHGVKLMYAENWLYAPAVQRVAALAAASGGRILEITAEESHSGSHAGYAKSWASSGGGALMRLGAHPIGAAIWLKAEEGLRRTGRPIRPVSVTAEVADLSHRAAEGPWLVADWQDVENWASVIIAFEDGSRAVLLASDVSLGGMKDTLAVKMSNAHLRCDLTHSSLVQAYAPDESVFSEIYIQEKLETKAGWSHPSVDEEWLLGYPRELRDFVEAVVEDHPPVSDAVLGREVVRAIYSAYVSAQEGRRIDLHAPAGAGGAE
jgi:predicted dehydrogenase